MLGHRDNAATEGKRSMEAASRSSRGAFDDDDDDDGDEFGRREASSSRKGPSFLNRLSCFCAFLYLGFGFGENCWPFLVAFGSIVEVLCEGFPFRVYE